MCVCLVLKGGLGGLGRWEGRALRRPGPSMPDNSRKMNIRHFKATVRLLESANSK